MIILILMAMYCSHIVVHRSFVRIDLQALIMIRIDYLNSEVAASSRISCLSSYMIILLNCYFIFNRHLWVDNRILSTKKNYHNIYFSDCYFPHLAKLLFYYYFVICYLNFTAKFSSMRKKKIYIFAIA